VFYLSFLKKSNRTRTKKDYFLICLNHTGVYIYKEDTMSNKIKLSLGSCDMFNYGMTIKYVSVYLKVSSVV
jgi:hypothetical protein